MPVELPNWLVIALNIVGWPVIHIGLAWLFSRMPAKWFSTQWKWARPREWELRAYSRFTGIRKWKRWLPDGAPWVRGVPKRNLRSTSTEYLQTFIIETRRGERAHWAMMFAGIVFFLWNPPWADIAMTAYAVAANLPGIITQRYNRPRLERLLRAGRLQKRSRA
jgi:glycosyl-4,4'-diaponeurosporenoate acyltransferase